MAVEFQHQRLLGRGWLIQAAGEVRCGGAEVSEAGFEPQGWVPAAVPSTVLAALAESGRCADPYFGMNLREIAQEPFRQAWWYRTPFTLSQDEAAKTVLLEFDGINYAADIWVNGRQIATSDEARGAFRRFRYDITEAVTAGDNAIAVQVAPPKPGDFSTGFVDWNPAPPDRNMGLFRPVRLRFCDAVAIEHPFVQTHLDVGTLARADLTVSADLVNHTGGSVSGVLEGRIEDIRFERDIELGPHEKKAVTLTADDCPELRIADPRIWWPHDWGKPELYDLELRFVAGSRVSDEATVRFGIRDIADYRTDEGHRGFKINGKEVLVKGAGWTDDLLLADTPGKIDAQLRYVRHMNLNCIRCEGVWGNDQTLYDLCDEYGILVMVGWSCHWEHEQYLGKPVDERYGGIVTPEDIELMSRSWEDQLLWLRHHPSIFVWAVASDKVPAPDLERRYIEIFQKRDPTRPYLASTGGVGSEQKIIGSEEIVSDVSGGSGVKMLGPYAYTPPVYWYTDTQRGGAYGFNTETCPGAVVPALESVKRMIPADHLWPVDEYWNFHCGLNEFDNLDRYTEAIRRRFGQAADLDDFGRKAQLLNYELMRPMFEAFRVNKGRATGVVQWMLNAAWPKMYWQLYDWYLMPTGAFYGARKACQSPQLVYDYGGDSIGLVNDGLTDIGNLRADIRVYDVESQLLLATHFAVDAAAGIAQKIFTLPGFEKISSTYFLSLRLLDSERALVADNFYWLSTRPDVLDYNAYVEPWEYYTPSRRYADFSALNAMPRADVDVTHTIETDNSTSSVAVELTNRGDTIAFFVEMLLLDEDTKTPIVPVFWQDNFVSLLPHETRRITATFDETQHKPALHVRGWNIEQRRC